MSDFENEPRFPEEPADLLPGIVDVTERTQIPKLRAILKAFQAQPDRFRGNALVYEDAVERIVKFGYKMTGAAFVHIDRQDDAVDLSLVVDPPEDMDPTDFLTLFQDIARPHTGPQITVKLEAICGALLDSGYNTIGGVAKMEDDQRNGYLMTVLPYPYFDGDLAQEIHGMYAKFKSNDQIDAEYRAILFGTTLLDGVINMVLPNPNPSQET